ncbi:MULTISPECIES: hypothetical protein [Streptomyces]|uniref:hypothetical protein n=1 Tax=Streptomyces TaxID=1883 RepID=UPI0022572E0C|nr:hypothetical protein [Streptomyces sp. NBC_00160]MCX5305487.1 hypothetical protein [Streptomyces sp. NBC_00160]
MTAPSDGPEPAPEPAPEREAGRGDYSGAVYGSLLAASVVVGAGTLGNFPRLELVALLLGTGVVFWAAHVFASLFGVRMAHHLSWGVVRSTAREERPIIKAAVPPAVAALVAPLFGLGHQGIVWLALVVALVGQVGWATVAAARAGASRRMMMLAGAINLFLGVLIVLLKVALQH